MNKIVDTIKKKQDTRRPFYKHDPVTSVLLILGVFLLSQLAAGILISLYPSLKNRTADQGSTWLETSAIAQFIYILLAEVFAVWLVFNLLKRARVDKAKIGIIRPHAMDIIYAFAGYAAYFAVYIVIIVVASRMSTLIDVDQPQQIGFDGASGAQLWYVFLSLVVLPPIAEEIMFRGFLFSSLRQKYRFRIAAVLTSILFGIAHLQFGSGAPLLWVAAIDTFVLSVVLCYLREKTNSLWSSIMLHAIKNGVAFVALFHSRF